MLAGVGGVSVEEAKQRITYAEALKWAAYRERFGPLNLGMRLEAGFALIAWQINRAIGGSAEMSDFMPHFDGGELTIEDAMKILTGKR